MIPLPLSVSLSGEHVSSATASMVDFVAGGRRDSTSWVVAVPAVIVVVVAAAAGAFVESLSETAVEIVDVVAAEGESVTAALAPILALVLVVPVPAVVLAVVPTVLTSVTGGEKTATDRETAGTRAVDNSSSVDEDEEEEDVCVGEYTVDEGWDGSAVKITGSTLVGFEVGMASVLCMDNCIPGCMMGGLGGLRGGDAVRYGGGRLAAMAACSSGTIKSRSQ